MRRFGPFLTVAIAFFLAELGDKTMLATVTLASQFQDAFPVWIGSTLGMVIADGLAVILGLTLGKRLPTTAIKYGSAAVFIVSGVATLGALMA
jgi:putative Ca2+/H+ antiporter (TMEM165/GDT1 family)